MDLNALGIPVAFVLLAALALWLIILGKGQWWLKMVFVSGILYFAICMWFSLGDLSGWPTNKAVPEKFLVHWMLVREGAKDNPKDTGHIYVWLTELDEEDKPKEEEPNPWILPFVSKQKASEPRAYRLPYSKQLHEQAAQVMQMLRAGKQVVGKRGDLAGDAGGGGEGEGKGKGKGKGKGREDKGEGGKGTGEGSLSQDQIFMFYELPPAKLPEK